MEMSDLPAGAEPVTASLTRLGPLYRLDVLLRWQVTSPAAALEIRAALDALLMPLLPPPEPVGTRVPATPPPGPSDAAGAAAHPDAVTHQPYEACPVCARLRALAAVEATGE